nr:11811_t:CDS:10 [Entrophospora candida]
MIMGMFNGLGWSERKASKKERKVHANLELPKTDIDHKGNPRIKYVTNKIVTSKYTIWTFLPKNLFEQFRKAANMYFLFMAILGLLPQLATNNPILTVLPLSTVVFFTAMKDAIEDRNRHEIDKKFNSDTCYVLQNFYNVNYPREKLITAWEKILYKLFFKSDKKGVDEESPPSEPSNTIDGQPLFKKTTWRNVRVGDFIFLRNGDVVPADSIILSTSEQSGTCYVETKDLDGETNLKPRRCVPDTKDIINSAKDCTKLKFYIESEAPNSNLYSYSAKLVLIQNKSVQQGEIQEEEAIDEEKRIVPLDVNNLLLRAHVIRNTKWVIAITIFTGIETKIMLNSGETPSKRSRIEKEMNHEVILNFIILIMLALTCAIGSAISTYVLKDKVPDAVERLDSNRDSIELASFVTFWASLIIFQNIIPISLYISIEFVRIVQAFFIYNDLDMWDEDSQASCVPKSASTLTRNIMEFRQCSIGAKIYGKNGWGDKTDAERGKEMIQSQVDVVDGDDDNNKSSKDQIFNDYLQELTKTFKPKYSSTDSNFLSFADPELFRDLRAQKEDNYNDSKIEYEIDDDNVGGSSSGDGSHHQDLIDRAGLITKFFTLLAICHTVRKVRESFININSILPSLKALDSVTNLVGPSNPGTMKAIPIDKTLEKNLIYKAESPDEAALVSAAKNLGFVFLGRSTDSITIDIFGKEYTYQILNILQFNSTRKRMSVIVKSPEELGSEILLFCKGADNVIFELLAPGQDDLIEKTSNDIDVFSNCDESHYQTWSQKYNEASTSLENRSQKIDQISEEIEKDLTLLGATAIEDKLQEGVPECITSLREAGIKVWVLTGDKLETAINIGFAAQLLTKEMRLWIIRGSKKDSVMKQLDDVVASLLGNNIATPNGQQQNQQMQEAFHSVICCRVSPLQKAFVVELIRTGKRTTTLAIGDGANDVSMIQAANVGIGISGQEGVQASMAADYSMPQFRFLGNLLLVHGHWDYLRISEMILNFFYKNVIWVFPVLWYQIFCLFSGNIFYDYSFVQLYNMIFTVAPVIVLGAMDQSVSKSYCLRYPSIYILGIKQKRYSKFLFTIYFLDGIWQSLVVYFIHHFIYILSENVVTIEGAAAGPIEFSTAVAVSVIVIANLFVSYNTYHWTFFTWASLVVEIFSVFAFVTIYGMFVDSPIYGIGAQLFSEPIFWFGLLFVIWLSLLPRYIITFVKQWWYPDNLDLARQIRKKEKLEKHSIITTEVANESPERKSKEKISPPTIHVEFVE